MSKALMLKMLDTSKEVFTPTHTTMIICTLMCTNTTYGHRMQ
jgi:hypothetical protein